MPQEILSFSKNGHTLISISIIFLMAGYSKDVNHGAFLRKLLTVEKNITTTTNNGQNLFFFFFNNVDYYL